MKYYALESIIESHQEFRDREPTMVKFANDNELSALKKLIPTKEVINRINELIR